MTFDEAERFRWNPFDLTKVLFLPSLYPFSIGYTFHQSDLATERVPTYSRRKISIES